MNSPKTWISVLTTPKRPGYIQRTLRELDNAGAQALAERTGAVRFLAVDGNPDEITDRPGWVKGQVGDGLGGTRRAMLRVIQAAADDGAESLLYFEDDVLPCYDAVVALAFLPVPEDCGFLVACDVRGMGGWAPALITAAADDPAFAPGFWGSMAVKIPGRALHHLRAHQLDITSPQMNAADVWLGQQLAAAAAPWHKFMVVAPSLFQHYGMTSAVDPARTLEGPGRMARNWNGGLSGLPLAFKLADMINARRFET